MNLMTCCSRRGRTGEHGCFPLFPQIVFEHNRPEIRGDYDEIRQFGTEGFLPVFDAIGCASVSALQMWREGLAQHRTRRPEDDRCWRIPIPSKSLHKALYLQELADRASQEEGSSI